MNDGEKTIADIVAHAEPFVPDSGKPEKPRLLVDKANPDKTIETLRDILSCAGRLYDRGVPVRVIFDEHQKGHVAQTMSPDTLVRIIHQVCRPYGINARGQLYDCMFPRNLACMYLEARGEWNLPLLNGIASSPMLRADGSIGVTAGYDHVSGMWCENDADLASKVPERPTRADADAALLRIRERFRTFPFADAQTVAPDDPAASSVVDASWPPGRDESAFLVALLTAVCRGSLPLAPGIIIRAAAMSGAGAGKGLLARCISIIAFGREPNAVTGGSSHEETEKRIAAELMEGHPVLFLDNLNNTAFKSDLLASAITERPARVRLLGKSEMVLLNSSALVILTGNALTISEDLARRFITIDFDARTEDPEARQFCGDIKLEVLRHRSELLIDTLTIWRWGTQSMNLVKGKPLGSFEAWSVWVRDPLIALGCQDPAERISEAKERDARRQAVRECFELWTRHHGERPMMLRELHDDIRAHLDPQGRGRQYLQSRVDKMCDTRMNGLQMTRQAPAGKWGTASYALKSSSGQLDHRGNRGDEVPTGANQTTRSNPAISKPPMPPMPLTPANENASVPDMEGEEWKAVI